MHLLANRNECLWLTDYEGQCKYELNCFIDIEAHDKNDHACYIGTSHDIAANVLYVYSIFCSLFLSSMFTEVGVWFDLWEFIFVVGKK